MYSYSDILQAWGFIVKNNNYLIHRISNNDREICHIVAESDTDGASVASVIEKSGISKSLASNYKKRLIKKGIVGEVRGSFVFSLPGFGRYVREQYEY